jgi:hypothetical protein
LPCDESVQDALPFARLPSRPTLLPEQRADSVARITASVSADFLTRARYLHGDFIFTTLPPKISYPTKSGFVLTGSSLGFPLDSPIPRRSHRLVAPGE